MSPPVQPQLPQTVQDWTGVLHRAAGIPVGHPDYADAQEAKAYALSQIDHLERSASDAQPPAPATGTGAIEAFGHHAARGVTAGLSDEMAGIGNALLSEQYSDVPSRFTAGRAAELANLTRTQAEHPTASILGDVAGTVALPVGGVARLGAKVGEAGAGLVGQVAPRVAPLIGRMLSGATTAGGIAGVEAAGRNEGSLEDRLRAGAGAVGPWAAAGAVAPVVAPWLTEYAKSASGFGPNGPGTRAIRALAPAVEADASAAPAATPRVVHTAGDAISDIQQAKADFAAGRLDRAGLETAMNKATADYWNIPETAPSSPPGGPTGPTPSAVAPTVGSLEPIPGQPRGFTAVGRPTPPVPDAPTVTDFQDRLSGRGTGKTVPWYPRGGQAEQAGPPPPVETPNVGTIQDKAAQLKMLLSLPPDQFEAAAGMVPRDMLADVRQLRANGATPAHVDALLSREGQFSGEGFEGTTAAMQHPAYQNAGVLARRAVDQGYPAFKGMTPDQATAALQRMILEHAQRSGGEIPALTTLPKFLDRLAR